MQLSLGPGQEQCWDWLLGLGLVHSPQELELVLEHLQQAKTSLWAGHMQLSGDARCIVLATQEDVQVTQQQTGDFIQAIEECIYGVWLVGHILVNRAVCKGVGVRVSRGT